jgi:superoxide dismutase
MSFVLPELPWNANSLEPHVSANTISFHYGKHHQGYVTKLNELVKVNKFIIYINIFFINLGNCFRNLKSYLSCT